MLKQVQHDEHTKERMKLISNISQHLTRPAKKLATYARTATQNKRITTLESQWQSAATARDTLFIARVLSRYRAHRSSEGTSSLLPSRTNTASISPESWEALYQPRRSAKREAAIDIILPITHSYEIVLPALYELLTSTNDIPFRVVALLSQHPDHKLTDKLRRLQELDLFDLLTSTADETLLELTNFAMQRHDTRDIVLLSSHIECADGWLDRLHNASTIQPATTASISPWLTAGGSTGYPDASGSIAHALEPTPMLDSICQNLFSDIPLDIIAHPAEHAVYIPRESLHSIGLLPEKSGSLPAARAEWAATAREKGFEHLFTRNVMLGTSAAYLPPTNKPLPTVSDNHAAAIDRARLTHQCTSGTLVIEGIPSPKAPQQLQGVPHLSPDSSAPSTLRIGLPDARLYPQLSFTLDTAFEPLTELCHMLGITTLLVRQPAGFPSRLIEWLTLFSQQSAIPYQLELSDDYLICPGLLGIEKNCPPDDLESCYRSFTDTYPLDTDGMPLWLWRVRSAALIEHASALHFTDEQIKTLFQRYFQIP